MTIISPALRSANNGNWQTAYRWTGFLREEFEVSLDADWTGGGPGFLPDCLIALHARRSAGAIARFAEAYPGRPLVVVLTGTDLYRDIRSDASAQRSLDLATHLVVLQEAGLDELKSAHRRKARVIYQSAPSLQAGTPNRRTFDIILVGHMRAEKDPLTPMRALDWLPADSRVRLIHVGGALEEKYLHAANELEARSWPTITRYRWLGNRGHAETRQRMRNGSAMVISSLIEGGANVIIEAVTSHVPVLASRIAGNVAMLGRDYEGYFTPGDSRELAQLFQEISRDTAFLAHLRRQCEQRAPLFAPERERAEVLRLAREAVGLRTG